MNDKKVMQLALDALNHINVQGRVQVIEALRTAIAQLEPHIHRTQANINQPPNYTKPPLRTALAQTEKIECSRSHPHENMGSHCQLRTEIARLTNENARLKAQPEPEPVAWMHKFIDDVITKNRPTDITRNAGRWTSLYTAPIKKEWVGLNDEDRNKLHHLIDWTVPLDIKKFADAVEAKLKEKNT